MAFNFEISSPLTTPRDTKPLKKISLEDSMAQTLTPTSQIPSQTSFDEDWKSVMSEPTSPSSRPAQVNVNEMIRKSKTYLAERDVDYMRSQNNIQEKEIRRSLNMYFQALQTRINNQKANKDDFEKVITEYVLEKSEEKDSEAIWQSDSLLWKSLKLVKQLTSLSQDSVQDNEEKLKLYIKVLASQLALQNHKYCETRHSITKGVKERMFLKNNNKDSLNAKNEWYQINKELKESKIILQINSLKNFVQKFKSKSHSWTFVVKIDDVECGRTSIINETMNQTWDESITINIDKDQLFDTLTVEIYECTSTPLLVGECTISLQEVFENTLFKRKFRVLLPITPNGTLTSRETERTNDPLTLLNQNQNIGLLRVAFIVNLDPSFVEIIREIREQRLENIDAWIEENKMQLEDQFELIRCSIGPINTLDIDIDSGIKAKRELGVEKVDYNDKCGICGLGQKNQCNMF